jgi:hypothetical protein
MAVANIVVGESGGPEKVSIGAGGLSSIVQRTNTTWAAPPTATPPSPEQARSLRWGVAVPKKVAASIAEQVKFRSHLHSLSAHPRVATPRKGKAEE